MEEKQQQSKAEKFRQRASARQRRIQESHGARIQKLGFNAEDAEKEVRAIWGSEIGTNESEMSAKPTQLQNVVGVTARTNCITSQTKFVLPRFHMDLRVMTEQLTRPSIRLLLCSTGGLLAGCSHSISVYYFIVIQVVIHLLPYLTHASLTGEHYYKCISAVTITALWIGLCFIPSVWWLAPVIFTFGAVWLHRNNVLTAQGQLSFIKLIQATGKVIAVAKFGRSIIEDFSSFMLAFVVVRNC